MEPRRIPVYYDQISQNLYARKPGEKPPNYITIDSITGINLSNVTTDIVITDLTKGYVIRASDGTYRKLKITNDNGEYILSTEPYTLP